MEYRNHPLVEGLRVNEDGSDITFNNEPVNVYSVKLKHHKKETKMVQFNRKHVTLIRLICEAWHGQAPNIECAARRSDESKGDHYSNLYWGKTGKTVSNDIRSDGTANRLPVNQELFEKINEAKLADPKKPIKTICIEHNVSAPNYYEYRKKAKE